MSVCLFNWTWISLRFRNIYWHWNLFVYIHVKLSAKQKSKQEMFNNYLYNMWFNIPIIKKKIDDFTLQIGHYLDECLSFGALFCFLHDNNELDISPISSSLMDCG